MKRIQNSFLALMATLFTSLLVAHANADEYRHIENQARRIVRLTDRLTNELRHFEHTPQFVHLIRDMQALRAAADHMSHATNNHATIRHIERDLWTVRSRLRHTRDLVDQIEHSAAYGAGHIDGSTRNTWRLITAINNSIIHIQKDLTDLRHELYDHGSIGIPAPPVPPVYTPGCRTPYGSGAILQPSGVRLGNGRVQFRFNF